MSAAHAPDLDAWDCDECAGAGWTWKSEQVGERESDRQEFKTDCTHCDGLGFCGPDAKARAAIAQAQGEQP